jgi:hypothetical protein
MSHTIATNAAGDTVKSDRITVVRFLEWPIGVHGFDDEERRVLDVELAKRLGFERPRKIRELIERLKKDGELPSVFSRPTVGRQRTGAKTADGKPAYREYPVTEYWLKMDEALFVTAKSETKTANALLWAIIHVFLAAKEAYEREQNIPWLARQVLALTSCEWDLMWPRDFVRAMCKLHGELWDGGAQPAWLASTYERIYKTLLGADVYRILKERNPDPKFGANHHQFLQPVARERLRGAIPSITTIAETVGSKEEFWAKFDHKFGRKMLQLNFLLPEPTTGAEA